MTIEINDRLYKELTAWTKANGMDEKQTTAYIEKTLREKLALDKYGDLNEKVGQAEPPKKKTTKKKEEPKQPAPADVPTNESINELISEQINEEVPKKRTKVLASK